MVSSVSKGLSALHRDERAQVSYLAVAAALLFVSTIAMVINSNDIVKERVRNQEVADVVALSAVTWHARGLNIISFVNVLNTKLLSMTVLVNSLHKTLPVVIAVGEVQYGILQGLAAAPTPAAPAFAVAAGVVRGQLAGLKVVKSGIKSIYNSVTKCVGGTGKAAWKIMGALSTASGAVPATVTAASNATPLLIAQQNYASFGMAVNGGALTRTTPTLPVKKGDISDFCEPMKSGGPGFELDGYAEGDGPVRLGKRIWDIAFILVANMFPHPIFYGFYNFELTALGCDGEPRSEEQDQAQGEVEPTNFDTLGQCRKYNATATWDRFESETAWISNGSLKSADFVQWAQLDGSNRPAGFVPGPAYHELIRESHRGEYNRSCSEGNSSSGYPSINRSSYEKYTPGGVAESAGMYYLKARREDRKRKIDEDNEVTEYRYILDIWVLSNPGEKKLSEEEQAEYIAEETGMDTDPDGGSSGASCKDKVYPYIIDNNNTANRNRYIGLAWTELDGDPRPQPFWSEFFKTPPERITAYAQAQAYNKLSEDTFTQDWRVRLEQANLLESALSTASGFDITEDGNGNIVMEWVGSVNNH